MSQPPRRAAIVQVRMLPAPPREVFAAWSEPDGLAAWMCPSADIRGASVEIDFRVGGRFRIIMHGDSDYRHHGEFLEIDPPRRIVMTWVSEWLPEDRATTRLDVTFEPVGASETKITLVHDELSDDGSYEGHETGWPTILEKLSHHLEKKESK